jgi:hypothetical protein
MVTTSKQRSPRAKSVRTKGRVHRAPLHRQGLRPIQIWVPDLRSPAVRSEAHRQSLAVAASEQVYEDQALIDSVSVLAAE